MVQRRAFSGTVRRGNEAKVEGEQEGGEEGSFDPKQIERESDEVDVCIVGGGKMRNRGKSYGCQLGY